MHKNPPTLEELQKVLRLNDKFQFEWSVARGRIAAGTRAGTPDSKGYWQINYQGKFYSEHRLVWLFVHGEWPKAEIDHIDRDGRNNHPDNLREANRSQNCINRSVPGGKTSKYRGVYWSARYQKWHAQIKNPSTRKNEYLGRYLIEEEAAAAYAARAREYHGEFYQQETT